MTWRMSLTLLYSPTFFGDGQENELSYIQIQTLALHIQLQNTLETRI